MAPKKKSPTAGKQQTLASSFQRKAKRQEEEEKLSEGRWQVLEVDLNPKVLEEKFITTSLIDCENYKQGAGSDAQARRAAYEGERKSQRNKRKLDKTDRGKDAHDTLGPDALDDEAAVRSNRWEEKGAAFVEVLALHVSERTVLPVKYQELLLHMVLNADQHTALVNVSSAALELLLSNARLHPASQQDRDRPHILRVNNENLWLPQDSFQETRWYQAVCDTTGNHCSKLHFLQALLGGGQQCVRQQLGLQQEQQAPPEAGPGPVGLSLALQYVTQILVQDFDARMKVFREFGPKMPGPKEGLQGDLTAPKLLSNSALAKLLSGFGNQLTMGWPSLLTEVIQRLVGLILETAPSPATAAAAAKGAAAAAAAASPLKQQKQTTSKTRRANSAAEPPAAAAPSSSSASPVAAAAAIISPGEIGGCARQLLRCTYDLFLVMEEERHMFCKEQKDTECRMLALILHNILSKKKGAQSRSPHIPAYIQDPRGKAALLSSLSPRACLHLLSVTYALDAAKRWETSKRETTLPSQLQWLQPYKEYAEGMSTVRRICDEGPVKIDPVAFLADLGVPEHLTQSRQGLLSHTPGDGFLTWLTSFTSAAAAAVQQGHLELQQLEPLKEAFEKVVASVQLDETGGGGGSEAPGLRLHERLALARTRRLLQSCGQEPAAAASE